MNSDTGKTWIVALALAVALGLAVVIITVGVLYDAIFSEGPGLSDNATQVLTAAFGGIIGVLGSYVGYRAASNGRSSPPPPPQVDASADQAPLVGQGGESEPGP